jgi:hypothetical protein
MPVLCLRAGLILLLWICVTPSQWCVGCRVVVLVAVWLCCGLFDFGPCCRAGRESDSLNVTIVSSSRHGRNAERIPSLLL